MKIAYEVILEVPKNADPESWRKDIKTTLEHRRMPLTEVTQVRFMWMLPTQIEVDENNARSTE